MDAPETATDGIALDELRAAVRLFAEREIAPLATDIDASDAFPRQLWPMLGDLGVLGPTVAGADGGAGLGFLEHLVIVEEVSRASASVGLSYAAHSNLCVHNLWANGSPEQRARWLPPLLSGEHVGALAMSEAEAGSDVLGSMRCQARRVDGGWVANGSKMWITNGPQADVRGGLHADGGRRRPVADHRLRDRTRHARVQRGPASGQARDAGLGHVRTALR